MTLTFLLAEDAAKAAADANASLDIVRAMLMVIGIVLLAVILVASVRGKIARRQSERPTAREQIDRLKSGAGLATGHQSDAAAGGKRGRSDRNRDRVSASELDEVRHLAALLDNKAERLEQLLAESEARIAALERLLRDVQTEGDANQMRSHGSTNSDRSSRIDDLSAVSKRQPDDPLTRSVYELADLGHNSVEIAQKLDEQVGKVDLILALRQR
jgi:hypothetical protein